MTPANFCRKKAIRKGMIIARWHFLLANLKMSESGNDVVRNAYFIENKFRFGYCWLECSIAENRKVSRSSSSSSVNSNRVQIYWRMNTNLIVMSNVLLNSRKAEEPSISRLDFPISIEIRLVLYTKIVMNRSLLLW